ncbi:putative arm repeat-containing protein [Carex littledalei]|uniref:Putative arm repeat-containing protein n=1 Tax=Carex littledalei TaxID=544730 RepID=A0A833R2L9_9POAL|nr:putative arm repeat-containing protein [Carex littledalei]
MEIFAERLQSDDVAERVGAAKEIRRLTRVSSDHRRALSCAVGPLVQLLSCASSREDEEEEALAVMLALLNLAVRDEKNKIAIVEAGSLDPITHYLQSTNLNLQEYAAALLLTLSASSHNKPAITTSNPMPLLFQILKDGTKQARTDSLMSLYNLSTLPQNLPSLLSLHPVPSLLTLIRSCRRKSSKIAEKSCALLESLVAFDQGRTALIEETGGVLTVVEVIEEGSLLGKEHAVGTLLTMCESNRDKYREVILSEGAIPGLLELTVHGTPKSRIKARKLLELLRNTYNRPRLEADTIENIVSDVVLQMDGQDCADKARRMVAEMVRVSMERSLRHLKQRAFYV